MRGVLDEKGISTDLIASCSSHVLSHIQAIDLVTGAVSSKWAEKSVPLNTHQKELISFIEATTGTNLKDFDIEYLWGKRLEKRIEVTNSNTIQGFKRGIFERIKKGKPFIYGLDSFDALTSDEELTKMTKSIEALERELVSLRTGRASPGLVENIRVEYGDAPAAPDGDRF